MKKIALGLTLSLSLIGLVGCSDSNETTGTKNEAKTSVQASDNSVNEVKDNKVVFEYNGKEVKGKELKEFAETYVDYISENGVSTETAAKHFILKEELMKHYKYDESEFDAKHKKYLEDNEGVVQSKGIFLKNELMVDYVKEFYSLDTNKEGVEKLYNTIPEKDRNQDIEEFAHFYFAVYDKASHDELERKKMVDFQQKLLNEVDVKGIDIKIKNTTEETIL